jgi:hypothetical protein
LKEYTHVRKRCSHHILGRNKTFPGVINANATSVYDWSLGSAGLMEKMAQDAESKLEATPGLSQQPPAEQAA